MAVNGSTPTLPMRHTVVPSAMHTTPMHENSSLPFRLYVWRRSIHRAISHRPRSNDGYSAMPPSTNRLVPVT